MQIVVNHLTRMKASRICVAGIDSDALKHVRPTTSARSDHSEAPACRGRTVSHRAVIELGAARHDPAPPESEDHRVHTSRIRHLGDLSGDDYLALLDGISRSCWRTPSDLTWSSKFGHLQLRFDDPDPRTYLPVTDIRFYEPDQATIRKDVVGDVSRRLRSGVDVYLMLGLARAWKRPDDDRERH